MLKIASIIPALNETDYLGPVLYSLGQAGITHNLVSSNKHGFHGNGKEKGHTGEICKKYSAEYMEGDFGNEAQTRNSFLQLLQNEGFNYAMIVDADEVHDPEELKNLIKELNGNPQMQVPVIRTKNMFTYFKYPTYQIMPQEKLAPIFMIRTDVRFVYIREVAMGIGQMVLENYPLYHFSYARPDEKIAEKLKTFEHKDEIVPDWFENIFKKWTPDMYNLHPTHPNAYSMAIQKSPPEKIMDILAHHGSDWVKKHLKV